MCKYCNVIVYYVGTNNKVRKLMATRYVYACGWLVHS